VRTTVVQPIADVGPMGRRPTWRWCTRKRNRLEFQAGRHRRKDWSGARHGLDKPRRSRRARCWPVEAGGIFINIRNAAGARAEMSGKDFERDRKLLDARVISQQEFDTAKGTWETDKALLDEAEQNVRIPNWWQHGMAWCSRAM